MSQKKSSRKRGRSQSSPHAPSTTADAVDELDERESSQSGMPSVATKTWLSIWVCFHLSALFVSFTSVVEPSSLQARLSQLVHPYLRAGHFAADDRPVYLAHGSESERPHRLQVTSDELTDPDAVESVDWQTVGTGGYEAREITPGLSVSDRAARWLSTAATLAENDQPGVVAELLLPIARHFVDAKAIRIVRFPTDLDDVNAVAESPYVARIVRANDVVSLIRLTPRRLSSQAVATPNVGSNGGSNDGLNGGGQTP